MLLRQEIIKTLYRLGPEGLGRAVFGDLELADAEKRELLSSVCSGHHLFILGPPGSGKTSVAGNLWAVLGDVEVVDGCPMNCAPADASCPWCTERKARGETLRGTTLPAARRMVKVQGSGGLMVEDLIGDLDPEAALRKGVYSTEAFLPGKLLAANRGILLIDFVDRVPERVLNVIMYAVQGGTISIGALEQPIDLDTLVIATGGEDTLRGLPLDFIDNFDVVRLGYVEDAVKQARIVRSRLGRQSSKVGEKSLDKAISIVNETRHHAEVSRGVGTRGLIRNAEYLAHLPDLAPGEEDELLAVAAGVSLPHRLKLAPEVDLPGKREQIVEEIVDKVTGAVRVSEELATLTKEDVLALVEEIAREDKLRKPLKYGAFDLLLKRIKRFPDTRLAQLYRDIAARLPELYPERYADDNLDEALLLEVEDLRKEKERIHEMLERKALAKMLEFLEKEDILERTSTGWMLSQRGINMLLEKLTPRLDEGGNLYGYGKHASGKKLSLGEGRVVGTRHYRFGDKYRDISFRDTVRESHPQSPAAHHQGRHPGQYQGHPNQDGHCAGARRFRHHAAVGEVLVRQGERYRPDAGGHVVQGPGGRGVVLQPGGRGGGPYQPARTRPRGS